MGLHLTSYLHRWRQQAKVLAQLQSLATRLQLPNPSSGALLMKPDSRRSSKRMQNCAYDNATYHMSGPHIYAPNLNNGVHLAHNEFNASVFPLPAQKLYGVLGNPINGKL